MIKKVLAGCIIVYALFMGFVLIKGGLKDQENENSNTSVSAPAPNTQTNNSPSSTPSSTKTYTLEDVSKRDATSDCWIIINNKVYETTSYIEQHPGGAREITRYCGKDATAGFESKGGRGNHSSDAQAKLADFQIGTIK